MVNLEKKTLLYVSQQRFSSCDEIPGKFFYEAKYWSKFFKRSIFVGHSNNGKFLCKREGNFLIFGIPFDLSNNERDSVKSIFLNWVRLNIFLIRVIKVFKIDLIREGNLILVGLPSIIAAKLTKTPIFCWLGGFEREAFSHQYKKSIFSKLLIYLTIILEYLIFRQSNMVITVSKQLFDLIGERGGKNRFLSPNFVDFSVFTQKKQYKIDEKKIKILFTCRMEKEKGIDNLLWAIDILSKSYKNFELNLIGYGSMKPWIENYIESNNLKQIVHLLGKYRLNELPKFYHQTDIFVIPSYTEGLPAALIEAMATGNPVVCTDVGMISNYVYDNINGFLVPAGSPKLLAEKISYFLKNPKKIEEFGKKSREILEKKGNYIKINMKLYQEILKYSKNK